MTALEQLALVTDHPTRQTHKQMLFDTFKDEGSAT